jgi:dUTPase
LDVGLVDPDYEGPIGSIVINFSKENIPLNRGERFFRVIFMSHPSVKDYKVTGVQYTSLEYIQEHHTEISRSFPSTFLNTEDLIQEILTQEVSDKFVVKIRDYLIGKYWWKVLLLAAVFGVIITGVLVPLYNRYFQIFPMHKFRSLFGER